MIKKLTSFSRDAGLPDQSVASGGWPQPEAPEAARFASLQEHYRTLAQREKLEKETRRFCGRKLSYMQLTDKYGLSAAVARKRAGLPPLHNLSIKGNQETSSTGAQVAVAPSESKSIGKTYKFCQFDVHYILYIFFLVLQMRLKSSRKIYMIMK